MADEPTLGEIMRALTRLEIDMNRRFSEQRTVSQDAFTEYRKAVGERIGVVEADVATINERSANNFRLVLASFVFPILVALTVAALMARGG